MQKSNILKHKKVVASFVMYFTICLFISKLIAQSDSTAYCPMAIEGATWVVYDDVGRYEPYPYHSYVMRISGDSIFDNKAYKVVHIANFFHERLIRPEEVLPPYQIDEFKFFGLLRDDTLNRQVLGVVPKVEDSGVVINDVELLIHDFGLSVGDTMLGAFQRSRTTLREIQRIEYYGKIRNTHLSTRWDPIAEGIGNIGIGPLCQTPAIYTQEGFQRLLDYCVGTPEECNLDFVTNTSQIEPNIPRVQVFPNPALSTQDLILKIPPNTRADYLSCYDMDGKLQFQYYLPALQENHRIKIDHLSPGVYIFNYANVSKKVVIR